MCCIGIIRSRWRSETVTASAAQFRPTAADPRAGLVDPFQSRTGELVQSPPHRRRDATGCGSRLWWRSASTSSTSALQVSGFSLMNDPG